ncbi:MAG: sigma-70 family RNA polymerase sigma factor [Vicinamibacterales bacterium]
MDPESSEGELRPLMIAALDGDAEANRQLLTRLSARLRGYFKGRLKRMNRSAVEAEDLVQEVLIAIHTRRHSYDRSQLFTPWAYAIARYKFVDYLRRTRASMSDVAIEGAAEVMAHDDREAVESGLDLEKLLDGISPKMRQAIQHVKVEGLSVREAARRSGMSESSVKVSVHRGLKTMARLIRREGRG